MKTYDLEDTGRGGYEPHYQLIESVDHRKSPDGLGEWVRREDSEARIRALEALIAEARQVVMSLAPGSTHWDGCEQHHRACAWLRATELETFVKPVKVHYSANDYEGLAVALADLLKQVNKFCEEQGEAEFYTGSALAALGQSDNEVHIKTLNDLRSQANRAGVGK